LIHDAEARRRLAEEGRRRALRLSQGEPVEGDPAGAVEEGR